MFLQGATVKKNKLYISLLALAISAPLSFAAVKTVNNGNTLNNATNSSGTNAISSEQKTQIEQIIHDYLVNHPEVLIEASQSLQKKQQQAMQEEARKAIIANQEKLFTEKLAVAGNPDGNITIVEFFDYQCIHCKKMQPVLENLIQNNKNLRVIYKEFPIFGKSSEIASKAALASALQGKYKEMHLALINVDKRLDDEVVMDVAKSVGLNLEKLKKDMESDVVINALNQNRQLAEEMHLMGTPAFVLAKTSDGKLQKDSEPVFIPGAFSEENMQSLINDLNKKEVKQN